MSLSLETILYRIKKEFRQEIIDTIDKQVESDLLNYYTKSDTYTKLEVNNLINNVSALKMQIVDELPTENIDKSTIYLLPKTTTEGENNTYEEYIWINRWELIGNTAIDISNLVTYEKLQEAFNDNAEVVVSTTSPTLDNWKMWIDESSEVLDESQEIAQDLLDYYRRSETYSKSEIQSLTNKEYVDVILAEDETLSSSKSMVSLTFGSAITRGNYGNVIIPVGNYNDTSANVNGKAVKYIGSTSKTFKISAMVIVDTSANTVVDNYVTLDLVRNRYDSSTSTWVRRSLVSGGNNLISSMYNSATITPTIITLEPGDVISLDSMSNSCTFKGRMSTLSDTNLGVMTHFLVEEV